jgi:hypothetical protein
MTPRAGRMLCVAGGVVCFLFYFSASAGAATYYWNSATTGNWNDNSRWTPNTGFPVAGDTAIFSGSLNGNCIINFDVNVAAITAQIGYTGAIDAAANNKNVTVSGDVTLSNNMVNLGSGTWTVSGNLNYSSVTTFDAGASTVVMDGMNATLTGSVAKKLQNLTVSGSVTIGVSTQDIGGALTVSGTCVVPSGRALNLTGAAASTVRVQPTGRITGMGFLKINNLAGIAQQSGIIDIDRLEIYGTHNNIAPGVYAAGITTIQNDVGANNTFTPAAGNYIFSGTLKFQVLNGLLVIDDSAGPNFDLRGELAVPSSASLVWQKGAGAISLTGGGATDQNIDFGGKSVEAIVLNDTDGGRKIISGSVTASSLTLTAGTLDNAVFNKDIFVTGDVTMANAQTNMGTAVWTVGGNWDSQAAAAFNANSGTVIFTGLNAVLKPGLKTFFNVTVSGSATLLTNMYISNNPAGPRFLVSGTFWAAANQSIITTGADIYVMPGARIGGAANAQLSLDAGLLKQMDGVIDIPRFNILHDCLYFSPGTFASPQVTFSTDSNALLYLAAGTQVFSGVVTFQSSAGKTYAVWNSVYWPNMVFKSDVLFQPNGGVIDWKYGPGVITLGGNADQTLDVGVTSGSRVLERLVLDSPADAARTVTLTIFSGTLTVQGLHIDEKTTVSMSMFSTGSVLEVAGLFSANQNKVTSANRVLFTAPFGFARYIISGSLAPGTGAVGTPHYITFQNLYSPAISTGAVVVNTPVSVLWKGVVFDNLNDVRMNQRYYLQTIGTGAGQLTLEDVRFRDKVGGVDGNGSFDMASDPGTICTTASASPAVIVTRYLVDDKGFGGNNIPGGDPKDTDGDATAGIKIQWMQSTKRWTAASNGSWTDGAKWTPGGMPTASDIVIFDNSSPFNCTIDANAVAAGIDITAGYTGVITQGAFSVTSGASGFNVSGGQFQGGVFIIDVNGPFFMSGGTFVSTSLDMQVSGDFTVSGGAFSPGSGTLVMDCQTAGAAAISVAAPSALNNFKLAAGTYALKVVSDLTLSGNMWLASGTLDNAANNLTVSGNATMNNYLVNMGNGTWTIGGDFNYNNAFFFNRNLSTVVMNGMNKTLTGQGGSAPLHGLTVSGSIALGNPPTSPAYDGLLNVSGTLGIPINVTFSSFGTADTRVTSTGRITGGGSLTIGDGASLSLQSGVIDVATFNIEGSHNQNVAAGTYASSAVYVQSLSSGSSTFTGSAGTYAFSGSVAFKQSAGASSMNIQDSTANPNYTFTNDVSVLGTVNWTAGSGVITLSGGGAATQYINFAGKTVEAIVLNDTDGGKKVISGSLTTAGLNLIAGTWDNAVYNKDIIVNGDVTMDNALTNMGLAVWTVSGNWDTLHVNTLNNNSGTLVLNGLNVQFQPASTGVFAFLTISGSVTQQGFAYVYPPGTLLVSGTLWLSACYMDLTMADLKVTSTGRISGSGGSSLIIETSRILQMDGVIDIPNMFVRYGCSTFAAGTYASTSVIFQNLGLIDGFVNFGSGTHSFNGSVTFQSATGYNYTVQNNTNNPNLVFKNNVIIDNNGGTVVWNRGNGIITLSAGGAATQDINFAGKPVESIVVNDVDGGSKRLTGDVTMAGLTVAAGALNMNNQSITVTGDISVAPSANWTKGTGTITLSAGGAATQTIDFAGKSVEAIVLNDTDGGKKIISGSFTADGIAILSGTLDANGKDISVAGNVSISPGAAYTANGNTLTLNGTGPQTFTAASGATLGNLTLANSGGTTVTANVGANALNISGTLALGQTGTLAMSNGASLVVSGSFCADQANITPSSRFQFTASGYSSYQFNGGLSTSAGAKGAPNNVTFYNLSPVVNVGGDFCGVLVNSGTATWTGLIFSNLNGTKIAGRYYLGYKGASPQVLTIEARFHNETSGVVYATFNAAQSPGTICAGPLVKDPGGIIVIMYYTNFDGIGGIGTDNDP